ncbi:hypothetical protein C8R46DRAFT_1023645 [Mycena filopes]|nr:hypothetical protein C8R46DRAFT_1023645 [Mycena filopes]
MDPIPQPSSRLACMQARPIRRLPTPPLAVTALQSKMPDLYESVTSQGKTLHRDFNSIKCTNPDCVDCGKYFDHLRAWVLEEDSGPCVEDAIKLQKFRAYLELTPDLEEEAGPAAANELATYKLKVKELEKQLERASKKKRKRPADEEASNPPPSKRAISKGDVLGILSNPNPAAVDFRLAWDYLHHMPRPGPQDDPLLIAQFLQHREDVELPGVHLKAPDFIVDLREVRGYAKVLSRAPHIKRGSTSHLDDRRTRCIIVLLRLLTVPRSYSQVVQKHAIPISPDPQLIPCDFPQLPALVNALTPRETATLLANRGFSLADADDAWQFCHNFVRDHLDRKDFPRDELQKIIASEAVAHASGGDPPRLHPQEEDFYHRVSLKVQTKKGQAKMQGDGKQ